MTQQVNIDAQMVLQNRGRFETESVHCNHPNWNCLQGYMERVDQLVKDLIKIILEIAIKMRYG